MPTNSPTISELVSRGMALRMLASKVIATSAKSAQHTTGLQLFMKRACI